MSEWTIFTLGVAVGMVTVALLAFLLLWLAERSSWDDTNGPARHDPERYHR